MTALANARRSALTTLRRRWGRGSRLETQARSVRNLVRYRTGRSIGRRDFYASLRPGPRRFGVYAMGGCDLNTLVKAGPRLSRMVDGACCIVSASRAARSRSDLLVQTLNPPPSDQTAEVIERLELDPAYFAPRLFTPEFAVDDQSGLGRFRKNVVVLGVAADTARTLYRHREHGFLVDPGGWWLTTDMGSVLDGQSALQWFSATFEKAGRISV